MAASYAGNPARDAGHISEERSLGERSSGGPATRGPALDAETSAEEVLVNETMLTTVEAAQYCGLSPRTLEKHRARQAGPRFVKLGRLVKYRLRDLEEWISQSVRTSTSDRGDGSAPR
jgi:predicted DNA-binding transcriptional regulator AlpA